MTYSASLSSTFSSSNDFIVTLPGGLFVTGGTALFLRSAADPTTVIDTETVGLNSTAGVNGAGQAFSIEPVGGGYYTLYQMTASPTTLTVGTVGTMNAYGVTLGNVVRVSHDGSQIVTGVNTFPDQQFVVTSTADASNVGYVTMSSGTAHASAGPIAAAGSGRALAVCFTDSSFELWSSGGTLLDSLAFPADFDFTFPYTGLPVGAERIFVAFGHDNASDPIEQYIGMIDTTGDTLSWAWGPTSYATNWPVGSVSSNVGAAWSTLAMFGPRTSVSTTDPLSFYLVDTTTGTVYPSPASTVITKGIFDRNTGFAGRGWIVMNPRSGNDWSVWGVTWPPSATYLRQRQSPVRAPSRVRPPQLRQRQRPEVT